MTSFLRDCYVYIPAKGYNAKLNAAFAWGGAKMLMDTIEYNFKVDIDDYLIIDFEGFKKLIDLMVTNPRKRFGIVDDDSYSVWDLNEEYVIDPKEFLSKGKATPFVGTKVSGRCFFTVCNGKIVYNRNE